MVSLRLLGRWLLYDRYPSFYEEHLLYDNKARQRQSISAAEGLIIYGAGPSGFRLSQVLGKSANHRLIAFVDDDPQYQGQLVNRLTVYPMEAVETLVTQRQVNTLLMAKPSMPRHQRKHLIESLSHHGIKIKTVPDVTEILADKFSISDIRHVEITDLLGRDEVLPEPDLLSANITNRVVMVTGAGGSIGSELCRQIAQQTPRLLILYEVNEFALYSIDLELSDRYPTVQKVPCLGSITDGRYFQDVLVRYGVQTIYHAAAYKHVPMLEHNPNQAILNNVQGTMVAAQTAKTCGVDTFVLISTDKAVRPTNMMGASKRVTEMILQALCQQPNCATRFMIVRFGNVMDSTGSVIPRFRKQIAEGKAVTVTHPDITRYFMSIPEASRLVIQAGALGQGGEIFLLDMGEPIKIYDLAVQMIQLSGLVPGKDIEIKFTGLRPGEKLYEELLIDHQSAYQTRHPKIFAAKEAFLPWPALEDKLYHLISIAEASEAQKVITAMRHLVPEFTPKNSPPLEPVDVSSSAQVA
jgi:FlaA1/EpsC-like NDP-sugar epimerase